MCTPPTTRVTPGYSPLCVDESGDDLYLRQTIEDFGDG